MANLKINDTASSFLQKIVILDDGKPINLQDYKIFGALLDAPILNMFVAYCGRQVGKSISVSLLLLKHAFIPHFRAAYIAPRDKQVKEFSKKKLGSILNFSPKVKQLLLSHTSPLATGKLRFNDLSNDVYSKVFATGSTLTLGFAADAEGVERLRGISADLLVMDEAQSMDIPSLRGILDPILDSSDYGILGLTGTPLGKGDPLSLQYETTSQHTYVVKCEHCGKYSEINSLDQIGDKGVLCEHCFKPLTVRNGFFMAKNPGSDRLGFHINRLIFPMTSENPKRWAKILAKVKDPNANSDTLTQELLGVASRTATRLIGQSDIEACAEPGIDYYPGEFAKAVSSYKKRGVLVYGIDWGGGSNPLGKTALAGGDSHTSSALFDCYIGSDGRTRMKQIYHKVFPLENPRESGNEILNNITMLPSGSIISADRLGGTIINSEIRSKLTAMRINVRFLNIQLGNVSSVIEPSKDGTGFIVARSKVLSNFFLKLLKRELIFTDKQKLLDEISKHYLAQVKFQGDDGGNYVWRKVAGASDDLLFSGLFAWLAFAALYNRMQEIIMEG